MSELGYSSAVILGIVQGLTEFLPVSSSAHLSLVQHWLSLDADSPTILLFDALTHIGTVVSILIVFAGPLRKYAVRLLAETSSSWRRPRYAWRIALLAMVASVPTAIIGLTFKDHFTASFANSQRVGIALLFTALLLLVTSFASRGRRGWRRFMWWQAVIVGVAQGIAIQPGISRSGSTICTATLCGLRRRWAAQFSFFIAMPAILGATAVQFGDTMEAVKIAGGALPWGPLAAGSVAAMIVGILALYWLLALVRKAKLAPFAGYCAVVGTLMALGII